jgi:predicted membrane-bound spermidine synthase
LKESEGGFVLNLRFANWIPVIFFLSGFAALLYQVIWQRALFIIFGINIESVTVVVTAFMLGLGIGSLIGGVISRNPNCPLLLVFGFVELGIGIYGFFSLFLFKWVGSFTLGMSFINTKLITFLLVLIPTLLMGSTLPLLVSHAVRISGNVGRSVGTLYFVNTVGSAIAAIMAALVLMRNLGQQGSVFFAAMLNLMIGLFVMFQHMYSGGRQ